MYPHQTTLVVGLPITGRPLPPQITFCYAQLTPPMNYNVRHIQIQQRPIDVARCEMAQAAIEWKAKYLFFMDEDVAVPSHALKQLIFHMEHHDDWAVIGGVYVIKDDTGNTAPMVFRGAGTGPFWRWHLGEVFEVTGIAMGCTLIRVEAFKDIKKPYFKTIDDTDAALDAVNFGSRWTEDLYFCDKLNKTKKWKIMADGGIVPDHLDMKTGKPYRLPPDSYPLQRLNVKRGSKKILDIGCGPSRYETNEGEVITTDIREDVNPDYRCDMRRLPFATGMFDVVHSSHTLEHVDHADVLPTLKEWTRVLSAKGELRLVLPNLEWAAKELAKSNGDKIRDEVFWVLYGQQTYRENFHRTGFTPALVANHLKQAGYKQMHFTLDGYNIVVRATRKASTRKPKAKRAKK